MGALTKTQHKSDLILIAILLGLPALLFWKIIFAGEVLYWGTPLFQFFPWRKFAVESYLAGQVPLWNPYLGNGTPLAANEQSAVFYPLNVIYLLFPIEKAMGYSVVLHVGLAGVFMYVFGRVLGLSRFGSFIAGLSYAFSGFLVSRAGFLSMTSTAAWLPLIMAAAEGVLRRKTVGERTLGTGLLVALGSLVVGLQLLAGHAQLSFYSLLMVVFYTLFRSWQLGGYFGGDGGARMKDWLAVCLPALGMLALGIGLAAVQLLPTAELAMNSVRANGAGGDFAMTYSLLPWQIIGLIVPDFFGNPAAGNYWGAGNYWEMSGYIGVFPLLAAGVGLLTPTKPLSVPKLFLLGAVAVSLLLALGRYLPIYPFVFAHLPGFGFFQAPSRFLFLYTLAAAVLAGIGSDALLLRVSPTGLDRLGKITLITGIDMSVVMAAFALFLIKSEQARPTFLALGKLGVLLAISGLAILLGKWLPKGWWQSAIALSVAADLVMFGLPLNPTTGASVYDSGNMPVTDFLRSSEGMFRVYTPDGAFLSKFFSFHSFRTFGSSEAGEIKRVRDMAIPDVAMAAGLQESYNYDPLQVGVATAFRELVDASELDPRLLGLMNVRYVLSDTIPLSSDLKPVLRGAVSVYENPAFLERAFVVTDEVVRVDSQQEALQELKKPQFNPRRTVILSEPKSSGPVGLLLDWLDRLYPVGPSGSSKGTDKAGATVVEYTPNRVTLATTTEKAGYLVLSDTYYPGWKAWVNGQLATVYRANAAFRAVSVPMGRSMVEFRYEPVTFKFGATVSALSLATAAAIAAWALRRRRTI